MMRRLILCALLAVCAALAQDDSKRHALIIGNDAYTIRPLKNAVNDARAMNRSLAAAGFRVILKENAGRAAMEEATAEFFSAIRPGDTALIFYAGHAIQVGSENVLIPTDFQSARNLIEVKLKSFPLRTVFDYLKESRAKTAIVIIDACRTNPLAEQYQLQGGLAQPQDAGKGTYIAYSTSPNKVATDNPNGRNSWFTEALADMITQPGLTLDDVFTRVRLKVESATGGLQTPWSITSLTAKFYFHVPKGAEAAADESLVARWQQQAHAHEVYGNWQEAIETIQRILEQKPGAAIEQSLKARLPYLETRNQAQTKFEAGEFLPAAEQFEKALGMDAFDVDAALQAANSALLAEQLPRAVAALQAVRSRGNSSAVTRAEAILKELAAAEASAQDALKKAAPKPPPAAEVFAAHRFGTPDYDAGTKLARQTGTVDLASITKAVPPPPPAPPEEKIPEPQAVAQADQTITLEELHVEVNALGGTTRDLTIEEFGRIVFQSAKKNMTVILNGKAVTKVLPFTAEVLPGDYEIRTVEAGQKKSERRIRVVAKESVTCALN